MKYDPRTLDELGMLKPRLDELMSSFQQQLSWRQDGSPIPHYMNPPAPGSIWADRINANHLLERAIDALRQSMNTGLSASDLMSAQAVIDDYEKMRRK